MDLAFQWRDRSSRYLQSAVRSGHPGAFVEYSDAVRDDILFSVDKHSRYQQADVQLAWQPTIAFFDHYLTT